METTIIWTKDASHPRITDTVIATVKAIGKGQLAATYITWTINVQLRGADEVHRLNDRQVRRVLNAVIRYGWLNGLSSNGHGVYRWK